MEKVKAKISATASVELIVLLKKYQTGEIELQEVLEVLEVNDIDDIEVLKEL